MEVPASSRSRSRADMGHVAHSLSGLASHGQAYWLALGLSRPVATHLSVPWTTWPTAHAILLGTMVALRRRVVASWAELEKRALARSDSHRLETGRPRHRRLFSSSSSQAAVLIVIITNIVLRQGSSNSRQCKRSSARCHQSALLEQIRQGWHV